MRYLRSSQTGSSPSALGEAQAVALGALDLASGFFCPSPAGTLPSVPLGVLGTPDTATRPQRDMGRGDGKMRCLWLLKPIAVLLHVQARLGATSLPKSF